MVTARAVADLSSQTEKATEVAQVLMPGGATGAASAARNEPEHDVIAGCEPADAGTDLRFVDDTFGTVPVGGRQLFRFLADGGGLRLG